MTNKVNKTELSYLVLYSPNIEKTRTFYESLGLQFVKEKHGLGAEHYACQLSNLVLELYPGKPDQPVRLGLKVQNLNLILERADKNILITSLHKTESEYKATVIDPQHIKIDLLEED